MDDTTNTSSYLTSALAEPELVVLKLLAESVAMDVEHFGGARKVAFLAFEYLSEKTPLELVPRLWKTDPLVNHLFDERIEFLFEHSPSLVGLA